MRVRDLRIDGFGRFANLKLGPFDHPVTVFYGPNEAGKSTLLAFIRRVLFGFPDRRRRLNPYPPLAGGRHGGSITIVSDVGEIVVIRRFAGTHGGTVTLTAESGKPLLDQELPRLLGHHSNDVFRNVFSFTLNELHDKALLNDESVNSQIYSAGMGATRLPDALKSLDDNKGRLFLKGGRKHAIFGVAASLDRVKAGLDEVADNALEYRRLSVKLKEVTAELTTRNERRREYQSRFDYQRRLESAWTDWNELVSIDDILAGLPTTERIPGDGVNRLEKLEERIENARREHESGKRDVDEIEASATAPIEHAAILEHSVEIRRLERRRGYFDSAVGDLPTVGAELSNFKNEFKRTLEDLGPEWDESRLMSFPLSIAVRHEVSQHQEQLRRITTDIEGKKFALDQAQHALQEATDTERDTEQRLDAATEPNLDDERIRQRRNTIRVGRSQLNEFRSTHQRVGDLKKQLDGLATTSTPVRETNKSKIVAAFSVAFAVAFFVGGAVLGGPALPVGIIAGLVVVGLAAYLFATNQPVPRAEVESPLAAPVRESLRQAENIQTELESELHQVAKCLDMNAIDDDSLINADESLDREEDHLRLWNSLSEDFDRAKSNTKRRAKRANQCKQAVKNARKALETAEGNWRKWLADQDLRKTLSPDGVLELRGKVELGRTQLRDVLSSQQRVETIENGINDYTATVEPLAFNFNILFDRDNHQIVAAAADTLVELCTNVGQRVATKKHAETNLTKAKRLLEERERDLESAQRDMERLLQSGGATDAEDYRKRADIHSQRRDLQQKRRDAIGRLQRVSGPGERLDSLKEELRNTDIHSIQTEALRAEEELKSVIERIDRLNRDLGSIQNDLKRLVGEEDSSKLRAERHRLLEKMRGLAREWSVRTIAENLLKEAQRKFERERQPDVVRLSAEFFRSITEGRYDRVFSPLGESEIHVTDPDGGSKQPDQLSRGTREQLFLSLRFGLIRDLGQRSETLPVIVDEALVNFDPGRGMRAASAFINLSQTNQVLVFTCHPQIVEWFVSASAKSGVQDPGVIEIE